MSKFCILNIDTTAVKYFFKQLRNVSGTEDNFMMTIAVLIEAIIEEFEQDEQEPLR